MLLELLKQPQSGPNGVLQALLAELFGTGQCAKDIGPVTFPAGLALTGTLPMYINVDVTSLNSVAGGTPDLKTFTLPAGLLSATGCRGLLYEAWGSFANNANAKTVVPKFGGTSLITVTATASTANVWRVNGSIWVRTATTQHATAFGIQGTGTQTLLPAAAAPAETLSGSIVFKCTGTQTSAADIIQDGFIIALIP